MKPTSDIIATVGMTPLEEGGRKSPIPARSFGCIMVVNGRNHDVRLRLNEPLSAGNSRQVGIDFLDRASALAHLRVGATFGLWEAGIIGQGKVEAINSDFVTGSTVDAQT